MAGVAAADSQGFSMRSCFLHPFRTAMRRRLIPLRRCLPALLLLLVVLGGVPRARAATQLPSGFSDELVADALSQPVGMAFLPGGRLLVAEQVSARILMLNGAAGSPLVWVGTVPGVNANDGERGLLGIAVDLRWPVFPYLYVHATRTGPPTQVTVSRFTATGDVAGTGSGVFTIDPASRYDLIDDAPDDAVNHNGGTVRFGNDGMLYASFGEDATPCAAQDTVSLRGVIVRLDVTRLPAGPGSAPRSLIAAPGNPFAASPDSNARLVWEQGLRNPFRFQVDGGTGELWIGDVGQNTWEELNRAGAGGLDFGWPFREGPAAYPESCAGIVRPPLQEPVFAYDRAAIGGGSAVIVPAGRYRVPLGAGSPFPESYAGDVLLSDFYAGILWRLTGSGDTWGIAAPVPGQPTGDHWGEGFDVVSDYAIGPDGAWYYCRMASDLGFTPGTGQIRRIVASATLDTPATPRAVAVLRAAYPMPSRGPVRLEFALARSARVSIVIHDLHGRRIRALLPATILPAASYTRPWDGLDDQSRSAGSGLYFARFSAGSETHEWRILLAR